MNVRKIIFLLTLILIPVLTNAQKKEIVAYYPEWRAKGDKPYFVKDIENGNSADKITVLNYAFIIPGPDSSGNIIPKFMNSFIDYGQFYSSQMSIDGIADDSTQALRGQFNQLKKLKERHPDIKILLSIGGWEGSKYFSDALLTHDSREIFINTCLDRFIFGNLPEDNGAGGKGAAQGIFDGFDIDWEYPVNGGKDSVDHNPDDNNNLTKFYKMFRAKLDSINPNYILTSAVPATEKFARFYNIYKDQQYLDWYNLMTYDYRGGWDIITGHNSNLLSSSVDTTFDRERNSFDKTVHLYNCIYGVSRSKLIPGAVFYGRGWGNVDTLENGLGMSGGSTSGTFENGFSYYFELKKLKDQGFKEYWDPYAMAPYLYNSKEKIFWTFDNTKSISLKAHYVNAYDLRGLMFWEISGDDSAGTLVNTIYTGNMPEVKFESNKNSKLPLKINVVKPAVSDWINEGTNVLINTKVTADSKSIAKVEFFGDGKSLGYDTLAPFGWVWFNIPQGKHSVKAVAYDHYGNKTTSQSVEFNVRKR